MKIAIADFRFHLGHRTFNGTLLRAVSRLTDDFVYFDNGGAYRDAEGFSDKRRSVKKRAPNSNSAIKSRLASRKYMRDEIKVIRREKCDKTIVLAFDLVTFGLFGKKYFNDSVYLWHHVEPDELIGSVKGKIFSRYMNKVNHIVHAPFIKDRLVEFGVEEKRIFVCPWIKTTAYDERIVPEPRFFVAPSGSNDDEFIAALAEFEKESGALKQCGVKLLVKSKSVKFDDGSLTCYYGYLTFEEYEALYSRASAIVMPFPKSFAYRESGTIIDTLSSGKGLIATDIPIVRHYRESAASVGGEGLVETFASPEELVEKLSAFVYDPEKGKAVAAKVGGAHDENVLCDALSKALGIERKTTEAETGGAAGEQDE